MTVRARNPNFAVVIQRPQRTPVIVRMSDVREMRASGQPFSLLGVAVTREEAIRLLQTMRGWPLGGLGSSPARALKRAGFFYGIARDHGKEYAEVTFLTDSLAAPRRWLTVQGPFASEAQAAYVAQSRGLPVRRAEMPKRWGGSKKRAYNLGPCPICGSKKGPFRKGVCNACAERARRRGISVEELRERPYMPRDRVARAIRVSLPWKSDDLEFDGRGLGAFEPKVIQGEAPDELNIAALVPQDYVEAQRFLLGFDRALDTDFRIGVQDIGTLAKPWRDGYALGRRMRGGRSSDQQIVRDLIRNFIRDLKPVENRATPMGRQTSSHPGRYSGRRYGAAQPWKAVILYFATSDEPAHTTKTPQGRGWYSLWIAGGTIYSYDQPLATKRRLKDGPGRGEVVYVDPRTFSRTTTKFQNYLLYKLRMEGWEIEDRELARITEPP